MPEVFVGRDDERGRLVVVEGAQADEILPVARERDAGGFGEAFDRDFALQPFQFIVREAGHFSVSGQNPVKWVMQKMSV